MDIVKTAVCILGIVTMVTGQCDVDRCLEDMSGVSYTDTELACPLVRKGVNCLEFEVNSCNLYGYKPRVQKLVDEAITAYRQGCGNGNSGVATYTGPIASLVSTFMTLCAIYNRL